MNIVINDTLAKLPQRKINNKMSPKPITDLKVVFNLYFEYIYTISSKNRTKNRLISVENIKCSEKVSLKYNKLLTKPTKGNKNQ